MILVITTDVRFVIPSLYEKFLENFLSNSREDPEGLCSLPVSQILFRYFVVNLTLSCSYFFYLFIYFRAV